MPEVPRQLTPATPEELRASVDAAAFDLPVETRDRMLAQLLIESGRGASLVQHNAGNLIATDEAAQLFWRPSWFTLSETSSERDRRLHAEMLKGLQPRAFRAYSNREQGVQAYVGLLRRRHPTLLDAATPEAYVQAWRDSGYTPDLDVDATTRTFRALLEEFGRVAQSPAGPPALLAVSALVGVAVFAATLRKGGRR